MMATIGRAPLLSAARFGRAPLLSATRFLCAKAKPNPIAVCKTTHGEFKVELYVDQMPVTASNFVDLAKSHFYDGLHFHRVIPRFMAQFGCPNSRDLSGNSGMPGTGGPDPNTTFTLLDGSGTTVTRKASRGKGAIPDEHTAKIHNDEGTLSMANAGPESGGSQFFINVERNRRLDWFGPPDSSKHPVFGKIIEGYEVIKAITEVPTGRDGRDRPNEPIQMISITVEE